MVFIWHEDNNVGNNAFMGFRDANGRPLRGRVMQDAADATIYFPTTKFKWASLPGRPSGRRPAYMSFVTNDGAMVDRFISRFWNLQGHAVQCEHFLHPILVDAHLCLRARDLQRVETLDAYNAASIVQAATIAGLAVPVDPAPRERAGVRNAALACEPSRS